MLPSAYHSRHIVILGLARQGLALARYLVEAGARVTVSDAQPAEKLAANVAALGDLKIDYVLGEHPLSLLDNADLLCLSGGVAADLPLAQEARRRGLPVSNDSQIFLEACPAPIIGITGSAGKTTTTTLTGRMCAAEVSQSEVSRQAWVGGNIGHPLIADVRRMTAQDLVVMELSSFQLEIMTRSPQVATVLNLTPNHLDRHGTMEVYAEAKSHILRHQTADGVAILNWDDAGSRALAPLAPGQVAYFSGAHDVANGTFLRGDQIIWRWAGQEQVVAPVTEIELRGRHNVLNVLAACALSGAAGVSPEAMRVGLRGFTGVEHRLEFVREFNGAKWYNDSIASAPERVIAALNAFDEPLIILAGGRDKKLPWGAWAQLAQHRAHHVILFGEAGPLIQSALEEAALEADRYTLCPTLADAVQVAARQARSGDVVLLSPGCTSFDEFKDFAERGVKFKEWVNAL